MATVKTMYAFEIFVEDGKFWSKDSCGQQGPSNYLATRAQAETELPLLADALGCSVTDLRVVEVEVQS
jgi:hypothetical protein